MSDLSTPPLSLVPVEGDGAAPAVDGFAWPTPPYACYPGPVRLEEPEPCQIEGMNGRLMNGVLLEMHPAEGLAKVRIPPARIAIPLRFNQFRKLVLTRPLAPLDSAGADPQLAQSPAVDVRIRPKGAAPVTTLSIGHLEDETGLYLFVPLDPRGSVQRCFVPKAAYDGVEVGARIGEVLVEQNSATPGQIEQALAEQKQLRSQKLGDILLTKQVVTAEELEQAIIEQARMPMVRIGEALLALGFISQAQLEVALSQQREDRSVPLGELLVRRGLVSRADLQTALARKMGYPLVDVTQFVPETEALTRLPYAVAQRLPALPLLLRGGRLVVAVEDPSRPEVLDDIEFASQTKLVPVLARANLLPAAIGKAYERIGAATGSSAAGGDGGGKIDFEVEEAGKLLATLEQEGDLLVGVAVVGVAGLAAPAEQGVGPTVSGSDGSQSQAIVQDTSWIDYSLDPSMMRPYLRMDGKAVFRWAAFQMSDVGRRAMAAAGVTTDDLDVFIPHQANGRINELVANQLELRPDVVIANDIELTGNTSAASIPLALVDAAAQNRMASGDRVLLTAFGGGTTWGSVTLTWPQLTAVTPITATADTDIPQSA